MQLLDCNVFMEAWLKAKAKGTVFGRKLEFIPCRVSKPTISPPANSNIVPTPTHRRADGLAESDPEAQAWVAAFQGGTPEARVGQGP